MNTAAYIQKPANIIGSSYEPTVVLNTVRPLPGNSR